jgi:hypothetical protein
VYKRIKARVSTVIYIQEGGMKGSGYLCTRGSRIPIGKKLRAKARHSCLYKRD